MSRAGDLALVVAVLAIATLAVAAPITARQAKTAVPVPLTTGGSVDAGVSDSLARADHWHGASVADCTGDCSFNTVDAGVFYARQLVLTPEIRADAGVFNDTVRVGPNGVALGTYGGVIGLWANTAFSVLGATNYRLAGGGGVTTINAAGASSGNRIELVNGAAPMGIFTYATETGQPVLDLYHAGGNIAHRLWASGVIHPNYSEAGAPTCDNSIDGSLTQLPGTALSSGAQFCHRSRNDTFAWTSPLYSNSHLYAERGRKTGRCVSETASGSARLCTGMTEPTVSGTTGTCSTTTAPFVRFSSTVINTPAGYNSASQDIARTSWNPRVSTLVDAQRSTNTRYWFGLASAGGLGSVVPAATGTSAIQFVGIARDATYSTNWVCCAGDGTNFSCQAIPNATFATGVVDLELTVSGSNLYCRAGENLLSFGTANQPAASTLLYPHLTVTSTDGTQSDMCMSWWEYDLDTDPTR